MDSYGFFGGIPPFFALFFLVVAGFIIFSIVKKGAQWNKNNNSPKLSVPAQVVTKRSHTQGGSGDSSAFTSYYTTFQVESGDRMELQLSGQEYGMLAEDDLGILTFQGTRFLSFERTK
ncbi:DUF2500 domain-containing protein [Psychrobacillus lasiicapitis]|uniref:DUF2500 domain-containing protein n=1 Tax=Psychrobacillus lasiicapitis TaxID=1636719 RepID=A0A544T595_9BACI|nr:DUF2500 domain-containing protein [Psychrobacillus lasiicapitis]TQR12622.1 DUF2500 domain-containing protein [Psychrobacillus lasiicapitis]GGA39594.1 membrane protein [Psychrobacillus lasiicapitis]